MFLVDEGYDAGKTTPVVDVTFNLGNAPKVVVDEADKENFQYGAYTKFDDNNNMQFKTFVETNSGYVAKWSTKFGPLVSRMRKHFNANGISEYNQTDGRCGTFYYGNPPVYE